MPCSVAFDPIDKLLIVRFEGSISLPMIASVASEVARIAAEKDVFFVLTDARQAVMDLSTIQIYELPGAISEVLTAEGSMSHRFRRALVVSERMKDFDFFETVSRNRGHDVMLFRDEEEARKWLLQK
jgi:hypothetical protein